MDRLIAFLIFSTSFSASLFTSAAWADQVNRSEPVARVKLEIRGGQEIRTAMYNYLAQVFQSRETMELVEADPQWTIEIVTLRAQDGEGNTAAVALSVVVLEHGPQMNMLRVLTRAWHYVIKAGLLDKDQPLAVGMRKLVAGIDQLPETDDLTTLAQHRMCLISTAQLGEACRDIVKDFEARLLHTSPSDHNASAESPAVSSPATSQ